MNKEPHRSGNCIGREEEGIKIAHPWRGEGDFSLFSHLISTHTIQEANVTEIGKVCWGVGNKGKISPPMNGWIVSFACTYFYYL